jgi:hypothetical protein
MPDDAMCLHLHVSINLLHATKAKWTLATPLVNIANPLALRRDQWYHLGMVAGPENPDPSRFSYPLATL